MKWQDLPGDARVWIYQSNRKLQNNEVDRINTEAQKFLLSWNSHGTPLHASIEIFHNLFLVIFVDEAHAMATGCSIDKSVGFVKTIEQEFGIELMDRMQIAYQNNSDVGTARLQDLSDMFKQGEITSSTLFYNNLVNTKEEFEKKWLIKASDSWISRFL